MISSQPGELRTRHRRLHIGHAMVVRGLCERFEHHALAVVLNGAGDGHGVLAKKA